jgi:hypothetical protein
MHIDRVYLGKQRRSCCEPEADFATRHAVEHASGLVTHLTCWEWHTGACAPESHKEVSNGSPSNKDEGCVVSWGQNLSHDVQSRVL